MNIKTQTSPEMTEELNKTPGGSRPRQQLTGGSTLSVVGGTRPARGTGTSVLALPATEIPAR